MVGIADSLFSLLFYLLFHCFLHFLAFLLQFTAIFRSLVLQTCKWIRVADMSDGKSKDDGYRGVHVYFQLSSFHYPIEIQYNTYYDRQFSNWLHKYIYKKGYDNQIGCMLRQAYENAKIRNENEFRERLNYVLSDSEKI